MSPENRLNELRGLLKDIKKIAAEESGMLKGAGQDSGSWKSVSKLTERAITLADQAK
jgi:hypothetical protein